MAKKKKKAGIVAHQLPSGSYRVRIYAGKDENGKNIYKSFVDRDPDVAIMAARDYKENKGKPEEKHITISEAVSEYISAKENVISPSTLYGYRKMEKTRFDTISKMDISDFDSAEAQKFINTLSATLSPKSVKNVWGLLLPSIQMQDPERRISVTLPAKRRIVRDIPGAKDVIRAVRGTDVELPAMLAMWLSLRMSEIRGIRYKDISHGVLTIRQTIVRGENGDCVRDQTKTYGSTRRLTIPKYIKDLIGTGAPDERIIKQDAQLIYKHFVKAIESAGLPHMRFHDLRHLNASVMLELGVPEKYAMERGGWTTNSTLQNVYQHTFDAKRTEVDSTIDDYFNKLLG